MTPQEAKFRQQYAALILEFETAFPGVPPPDPGWIGRWLKEYNYRAICDAIRTLQSYTPDVRARYTQESVGRAVSSLLRAEALKRALAPVQPKVGGVK